MQSRTMHRALVLAGGLALAGTTGLAAVDDWAGHYRTGQRPAYSDIVISKRNATSYAVKVEVARGACTGEIEATGTVHGGKLVTVPPDSYVSCILTISKTPGGISVAQSDGCSAYHGAACEFEGAYPRQSR